MAWFSLLPVPRVIVEVKELHEALELFYEAYPHAQQGSAEAQTMGRAVLVNQFVCGLRPDLKTKLAGKEGEFKQMLTLVRFKEAKVQDLKASSHHSVVPGVSMQSGGTTTRTPSKETHSTQTVDSPSGQGTFNTRCFECGKKGHRARNCPYCMRREEAEKGANEAKKKPVSAISLNGNRGGEGDGEGAGCVEDLRRKLQEAEIDAAVSKRCATLHGITTKALNPESVDLGAAVYADVKVEG